ncbi:MAG TPA: hypothetical protein VFE24_11235 [Pirellulales bacterium]|nr:hypothetical protein [Pirellulales bacterium]
MKTERRHELQSNELATWINKHSKSIEPYFKVILGVLIAGVVVALAYTFISNRTQAKEAAEWDKFFEGSKESLGGITERYSANSALGVMARLAIADTNLQDGLASLFKDRGEANKNLKLALDDYTTVASDSQDVVLVQLAHCGKAKAEEALNELDAARKDYQFLVDQGKDAIFADYAKQRLTELNRPSIKDFYDRVATFNPKPSTPELKSPFGGLPDATTLPGSLLDKSNLNNLPATPLDKSPADKTPSDKGLDLPPLSPLVPPLDKTPADKGATDKGATDKGATDKGTTDKGATDKQPSSPSDAKPTEPPAAAPAANSADKPTAKPSEAKPAEPKSDTEKPAEPHAPDKK